MSSPRQTERETALRLLEGNPSLRRMGRGAILAELARRHLCDFAAWVSPRLEMEGMHRTYYGVLERFARGDIRRLIISMPPQHGKSTGSTVMLPAWVLGLDPDRRIAIASYNASLAVRFNRQIQRLLGSSRYAAAFPRSALPRTRKSADGYSRTGERLEIPRHEGGVMAVGREGSLTGNSVDMLILDDLYKDAMEANSPLVRDNCWRWYTQVARTRLHNLSQELIVFTRWHEEDLIGRLAACERITPLTDPAQMDAPVEGWLYLNFEVLKESPSTPLDPRGHGAALWPARHGAALLEGKRRLDPHSFAALYQGRPCSGEGLLYGERFATWERLPDDIVKWGSYTDTADTGDDYLCSFCYGVGRDGTIYVTDAVYTREPMEVTEGAVARMLRGNGTRTAVVESNNGGRGFARALQRALPSVAVEWFHQSAGKEARILSNAPTVLRTVRMPRDWALRWPDLHSHLVTYRRTFRANRWHDAADALTGAVERNSAQPRATVRIAGFKR